MRLTRRVDVLSTPYNMIFRVWHPFFSARRFVISRLIILLWKSVLDRLDQSNTVSRHVMCHCIMRVRGTTLIDQNQMRVGASRIHVQTYTQEEITQKWYYFSCQSIRRNNYYILDYILSGVFSDCGIFLKLDCHNTKNHLHSAVVNNYLLQYSPLWNITAR